MIKLEYSSRGEGEPVVLLHGLYGSGSNLIRVGRHLASSCRVIQLDLRNHGRSPHSQRMDYTSMAEDVVNVLDRERIRHCSLIGHSMGGKVAMVMALTRPERVSSMIVADIAPTTYRRSYDNLIASLQSVDVDSATSRADVDSELATHIEDRRVRQFLLTNLQTAEGEGYSWRIPLDILANAVSEIAGFPDFDGVYLNPALFVYGSLSDYFVAERDKALVDNYFPNAEFVEMADTGHWLHAEKPAEFNCIVSSFFREKGLF